MFRAIKLYLNTVRHLKPSQIFYRIKRKIFREKVNFLKFKVIERPYHWKSYQVYKEKINTKNESNFLNKKKLLKLPNDWSEGNSKLWLYNLHYFDDLNSENCDIKKEFHQELIKNWISHNKNLNTIGWEPYPTSIRLVNFIKAWLSGFDFDDEIVGSIHQQAQYLRKNLEKDILANHYFSNIKALLFYSCMFDHEKFFIFSLKEITREIDEQVLDDGGNYERSPMYHLLFLVDLLDIYNLLNSFSEKINQEKIIHLQRVIKKMIFFSELILHDGDISHFNDSVEGIAPQYKKIIGYAEKLGIVCSNQNKEILSDLKSTGFFVGKCRDLKIIYDAGNIGPSYQPGHSHAQSLSFELSYKGKKVFVNSGISEYENSKVRFFQRSTASHNTVEINSMNSSEVWHSFRVARRAKVYNRCSGYLENEKMYYFKASHNGYSTTFNKVDHIRKILFNDQNFFLEDTVLGKCKNICSRIYLHPEIKINSEINGNNLFLISDDFEISCKFINAEYEIINSNYFSSFGKIENNKCIKIMPTNAKFNCEFNFINS